MDFSISGLRVYALYGSQEDVPVPAGKGFEIHAEYTIINAQPGLTAWTTCMTVWDVTHNKAVGSDPNWVHYGAGGLAKDAVNVVMPADGAKYRVKIWATQSSTTTSPPQSSW